MGLGFNALMDFCNIFLGEKKWSKKHNRESTRKRGRGRREDTSGGYDADESDADDAPTGYQQVCIQVSEVTTLINLKGLLI